MKVEGPKGITSWSVNGVSRKLDREGAVIDVDDEIGTVLVKRHGFKALTGPLVDVAAAARQAFAVKRAAEEAEDAEDKPRRGRPPKV